MLAFNIGVRHIASCLPANERIHEQLWDSCPPTAPCSTYDRFLNAPIEWLLTGLAATLAESRPPRTPITFRGDRREETLDEHGHPDGRSPVRLWGPQHDLRLEFVCELLRARPSRWAATCSVATTQSRRTAETGTDTRLDEHRSSCSSHRSRKRPD